MPSFDKTNPDGPSPHAIDHAHHGLNVDGTDTHVLSKAIDLAVDYRGDVTIIRNSDPQPLVGYIFDRRRADSIDDSTLRLIPKGADAKLSIAYSDIRQLTFTGRDTAAGKSFETWMKKYVQSKLSGREASIHSETLDDAG